MKIYLLESGVRIDPYDDPVGELPVGGVSLFTWQSALFARFGLELVRSTEEALDELSSEEPFLVCYDNCFFTRRVLKSFLARWRARDFAPSRLALPLDCGFIRLFSALQDYDRTETCALFNLWGLPPKARFSSDLAPEPLEVIYKEKLLTMPMPQRIVGVERWEHPITTSVVLHIRHWLHLLQANRLSIQIRWVDEIIQRPWWGLWILARALLGRGRWPWRILGAANKLGRNVDVHPTARLEGCIIGDDVRIGAFALLRGSIIGRGAKVEERVTIAFSVVGEEAHVAKNVVLYGSAAMEGANLGGSIQMCLIGRKAALTPRTTPLDALPGRRISVRDGDQLVETDLPVLGSAFGHECLIGADIYIAPGRAIPRGIIVAPLPERVLSRLPEAAQAGARLYVVRNGRLEELG